MISKQTILINDKEVAIRSYEVSIWTLLDSFITVLKWANLENKGLILKPKIILDVDGTENFNFSIPMYLEPGKENPIWYNTLNGNLMLGMRKIKVILNKKLPEERVFEFVITKVKERHEQAQLFCDVECEGLAFHELGKVGYKISLSADEFYTKYNDWFYNDGLEETKPFPTLDYWLSVLDIPLKNNAEDIIANKWYYEVCMNWDAYNSIDMRDSNKIYEDEYVSSWELNDERLIPSNIELVKEKCRLVEINESNIYNITKKIAETFNVFCRYEYGYDDNYHIISRTIIFYNNFIEEKTGYMDLTYPYHTSEITREMDSSELTTKLFVRPIDYQYSGTGQTTIMSVDANKSREDYILNFNYLHAFNIITDELYAEISNYEVALHDVNVQLENLETQIIVLELRKLILESKILIEKNGKDAAEKLYTLANDHLTSLTNNNLTGTITVDKTNAKVLIVLQDKDTDIYYVKMPFVGVVPETVRLYNGALDYTLEDPFENTELITNGEFVFDEYGQLILISRLQNYNSLWLTCDYVPDTYWTTISNYWSTEASKIATQLSAHESEFAPIVEELNTIYETLQELLAEKELLIKEFNEMMGPALREGYWQPDDYKDYGNKQIAIFEIPDTIGAVTYIYDTNEYEEDSKLIYYEGLNTKKYLTVDLSSLEEELLEYISTNYDLLSFIYYDKNIIDLNNSLEDVTASLKIAYIRNTVKSIPVGAGCRFGFVKVTNGEIKPALIIEESKNMTDELLTFFSSNNNANYISKIGIFRYDATTNTPIIETGAIDIRSTNYITNSAVSEVHRRILIKSLSLKTSEDELLLCIDNTPLKLFEDYSVFIKTDINDNVEKYFINIKPQVYFLLGKLEPVCKISYTLSNADLLIYLDALQVSKENAFPKVAYTVKLSLYLPNIIHDIYNKMSKIVHINDNQLKFTNVLGYISHIEMSLDTPWEDSIEVKNYKTKFEDLFSSIVAQTEAMSKNSFGYDIAANAFDANGALNDSALLKILSNTSVFNAYLDSYFDSSLVVRDRLADIFTEAGAVLNDAGSALFNVAALTTKNADILAGFARGANEGFTKDIELISSDGSKTSAISISKDKGIFIGANLGISIFSGGVGIGGSSVDLNKDHLLLGVSDNEEGTAAVFTKKYIVLAAGDIVNDEETDLETLSVTGVSGTLVGAKLTKGSIGFATLNNNIINAVLMNDKGVTIGSEVNVNATTEALRQLEGSYVRIAPTGIDLGSTADLYINTNNFKLLTNNIIDENTEQVIGKDTVFAIGVDLQSIDENTTVVNGSFYDGNNLKIENNNHVSPDVNFLVNKKGAYIKGTVYASTGSFTGNVTATSLTILSNDANDIRNLELLKLLSGNILLQIDGEILTWTGKGTPVPFGRRTNNTVNGVNWVNNYTITDLTQNITHVNHDEWHKFTKSDATEEDKKLHVGDIYYDIATTSESKTAGNMYRWIKNNNDYYWVTVGDTISTKTTELVLTNIANIESIFKIGKPLGNYFSDNLIYGVNLNTRNGLLIIGNESYNDTVGIFRANHNTMGFFSMEPNDVASCFAYNEENGLYITSETTFTNKATALLYYKNGSMYISGTLFADDIVVRNRALNDNLSISFNNYIDGRVTVNLIEDRLAASLYWDFLSGGYNGIDTHITAQNYWITLQNTVNDIPDTYATKTMLTTTNTNVTNIINGNTGLAFTGITSADNIYNVLLNKSNGLLIEGYIDPSDTNEGTMYLKATHGAIGFFKKVNDVESAMVYIDGPSGDLGLKGMIYAESGWIGGANGWLIGTGAIEAADGSVLLHTSTANTQYSSGATFALRKKNNDNTYTNKLVFDGNNLSVTGTILATGGWFGDAINGWLIGGNTSQTYNILGTSVSGYLGATLMSANNRIILAAGSNNSSPVFIMKNWNNLNVFEFWGGDANNFGGLKLQGTILASAGWFGAEDGWVIGGNVRTNNITTILSNVTLGSSGSRILSANDKVIINAGSANTEPYIIMRKDNGNGLLEDVFEYYNGLLALKGNITATGGSFTGAVHATSFELTGASGGYAQSRSWLINTTSTVYTDATAPTSGWTNYTTSSPSISSNKGKYLHTKTTTSIGGLETITYDITYISKDGADGEDGNPGFTVDGLSNGTRKRYSYSSSPTVDTVELTSTHGLVLGANYGVYVARSSTSALSNSYASITSSGINFDYSSSNYVHIDNTGIDITGNRISINGNEVWARDDIIIMNPNDSTSWRRTVSSIESHMNGATHDWVLIKPYYNAECVYISNKNFITDDSTKDNGELVLQGTGLISFGNDANYFKYTLSFDARAVSVGATGFNFTIKLSNSSSFSSSSTITCTASNVEVLNSNSYVSLKCPTVTSSGTSKINLCDEGTQIFIKITENSGTNFEVVNVKLLCEADATTSRVPCTVYYYPYIS